LYFVSLCLVFSIVCLLIMKTHCFTCEPFRMWWICFEVTQHFWMLPRRETWVESRSFCPRKISIAETPRYSLFTFGFLKIEHRPSKNVINCLNTNMYSYLETSAGQSSNLYLNVVDSLDSCGSLRQLFSYTGVEYTLFYWTVLKINNTQK